MTIDQTAQTATGDKPESRALARRLNVTSRGLFFVWLGLAVLAHLGWGWTLTGIGVIVLGEQAARWKLDLKLSTAWTIGGAIFLIGGLWQLISHRVSACAAAAYPLGHRHYLERLFRQS